MGYAQCTSGEAALCLSDVDPRDTGNLARDEARSEFDLLHSELRQLQQEFLAARINGLLLVFQGMDASGKDGVIRRVLGGLDPRGCRVESFRMPTPEDLSHDFLWRVHRRTPAAGEVTAFNRSHYEDVVAARVKGLAPQPVWQQRYGLINDFERLLVANGTLILKFFLHVSREEQERRLEERRRSKRWKLSASDWQERQRWGQYVAAYEDAINRCATPAAPWFVVPADHKWFRNLAVCEAIVEEMRQHSARWLQAMRRAV